MVAASQSQLATYVLEHFCVPGHESSIQHLKQCAEAACQVGTGRDPLEQFPCEECCKALEQIAYTSLSKELDDLRP